MRGILTMCGGWWTSGGRSGRGIHRPALVIKCRTVSFDSVRP